MVLIWIILEFECLLKLNAHWYLFRFFVRRYFNCFPEVLILGPEIKNERFMINKKYDCSIQNFLIPSVIFYFVLCQTFSFHVACYDLRYNLYHVSPKFFEIPRTSAFEFNFEISRFYHFIWLPRHSSRFLVFHALPILIFFGLTPLLLLTHSLIRDLYMIMTALLGVYDYRFQLLCASTLVWYVFFA